MKNYRETAPQSMKDLSSQAIIAYFEDAKATPADIAWFKGVLTSAEYQAKENPISPYNWSKIKKAFAGKYFPEIVPEQVDENMPTMAERIAALLND